MVWIDWLIVLLDKWIVIGPSIGFVLTILAFTFIKKGIENPTVENKEKKLLRRRSSRKAKHEIMMDFSFVNEES